MIIEQDISKHTLNICCSIICSFFSKKSPEYLDIFRNTTDIFYTKIAKIIQNGEFYQCNSPEGWSVYILLFIVIYEIKSCDHIKVLVDTANMIRVYNKSDSKLNILSLMASLIMIFSKTPTTSDDYDSFIDEIMCIVPINTYKLLVDILENIIFSRRGNGYNYRTFTIDIILTSIWRIVIIDKINYSIIDSKLLHLLHTLLERFSRFCGVEDVVKSKFCCAEGAEKSRFCGGGAAAEKYSKNNVNDITQENFRIILHILEYIVPYCITYDFDDYFTVVELKKIKSVLEKLSGAARAAAQNFEIENNIIDYILSVLSFTRGERECITTVCVPYKVRDIHIFEKTCSVAAAQPPHSDTKKYNEENEIDSSPPVAIPIKVPIVVYFADIEKT